MELIHIDVTKQKWRSQCGDFRKFSMGDHWRKLFEPPYLSERRRYRTVTHRYGYKKVQGTRKSSFWMNFKITPNYYSFDYLITIPVGLSSLPASFAEIQSLKKIFPMVTHTKFTKVPTLTPPFLLCDVSADKVHCNPGLKKLQDGDLERGQCRRDY